MTTTMPKITEGAARILRAYAAEPDAIRAAEPGSPIKFVATTAGVKRDGLDLDLDGLDTSNFERNPVFLWAHQYSRPPIGRVSKIQRQKSKIVMWVVFDQEDEFAVDVERKYREGFMTAVSIGWIILEFERAEEDADARYVITASDLLDLSAVPVPGDPDALMPRELAAVRNLSKAIEFRDEWGSFTPEDLKPAVMHWDTEVTYADRMDANDPSITTPTDSEFVGGSTVTGEPFEVESYVLRGPNGTIKSCNHLDDDGEADWNRVATEMVELLVSGTEDPESYIHLARHYRKLGRVAPEGLHSPDLSNREIRGLLLEGEWEIYKEARMAEATERVREAAEALTKALAEFNDAIEPDESDKDGETVRSALETIRDAFVAPEDDNDESEDTTDATE